MLTDAAIKRLQPKSSAYRVFESGELPGFGIRVTPAGAKTWFLRYLWAGTRRYLSIGHYPHTGVAAARQRARAALARLDAGIDPAAAPSSTYGTLGDLVTAWLAHQDAAGRRRLDDIQRMLIGNISADLLARPANTITAPDIRAVLAAVHQRGARGLANRLRAHLHTLFKYGLQHDHDPRTLHQAVLFGLTTNPVESIPRDAEAERAGERVLTWAEVRLLWHDARLTWPARQACRLLLCTGARVNEICGAAWNEFDLDAGLWTLPAGRSKNKRENILPLPPLLLGVLLELKAVLGSDWLFPARNSANADQSWGNSALAHAVRLAGYDWTPRDLRRTWKTLTGECGIDKTIRDRIQNHAQQDVSSRHYDRYEYLPEKRAALETWCSALAARIAGENVIPLRRALNP